MYDKLFAAIGCNKTPSQNHLDLKKNKKKMHKHDITMKSAGNISLCLNEHCFKILHC